MLHVIAVNELSQNIQADRLHEMRVDAVCLLLRLIGLVAANRHDVCIL